MIDLLVTMGHVKQIALEVGVMQKENFGMKNLKMNTKSTEIDLVTEIDQKSEKMIVDFIRKLYPAHGILAEESGLSAKESDYLWIIDPLDGTTNYSQGLPIFAVSIALQYKEETVLGVVYMPVLEQLFTAMRGRGAYLNGQQLQVSQKMELVESVLATGFPYDIATKSANNINYFSEIVLQARAVRRMGAAAYDVACVAAGKYDGYWEMSLAPWDVAAAILIVKEAGGQVIHFRKDRGISIIAGNDTICQKIHDVIGKVDKGHKKHEKHE